MTTTNRLLDAWKLELGITSDNQAAIRLGVNRSAVSSWRSGVRHASPALAARMAHDLKWDGLRTLAAIEAERAVDSETKKAWLKLAGKALSVALLAMLFFRERLSRQKAMGLAVGMVAVALLNR